VLDPRTNAPLEVSAFAIDPPMHPSPTIVTFGSFVTP
jgi:hypothetical protein